MLAIPCESNDKREMGIGKEKQEGWRGEEAGKHLRGRYYWRCPPRVRGGEGLSPKLPYAGVRVRSLHGRQVNTSESPNPHHLQVPSRTIDERETESKPAREDISQKSLLFPCHFRCSWQSRCLIPGTPNCLARLASQNPMWSHADPNSSCRCGSWHRAPEGGN
jgi:hypothetical protein